MNDNNLNSNTGQNAGETENPPLMQLFNRTGALMHRYLRFRLHSQMHDPNRGQGRVLSILRLKPEISQKDLAYMLDMRSQSLGELLMKLEKAGYITRTPAGDDRRAMNISLTDAGKAAADQAEKSQTESGRLFDCLNTQEQSQLAGILRKLIMTMESDSDENYDAIWEEARRHRHEALRHGQEMRDELRGQARDLRDHIREQGRAFRHQMRDLRRDFIRDGMCWDDRWEDCRRPDCRRPDEGFMDEGPWNDGDERGNGPRR